MLASQGDLAIELVIPIAAAGAIIGDNFGYLIGARFGRRLLTRPEIESEILHAPLQPLQSIVRILSRHRGALYLQFDVDGSLAGVLIGKSKGDEWIRGAFVPIDRTVVDCPINGRFQQRQQIGFNSR